METRSMTRSRLAKLSSNKDNAQSAKLPEDPKELSGNRKKGEKNTKIRKGPQRLAKLSSNKDKYNAQPATLPGDSKELICVKAEPESLEWTSDQKKGEKTKRTWHQATPGHCTQLVSPVEDKKWKGTANERSQEMNRNTNATIDLAISETTPKFHAITLIGITVIASSVIAWNFGVVPDPLQGKIYKNGLLKLQEDFKNQTQRFWKILISRGLSHLRKTSPPKPLVMLFAAPPSAHSIVDCFTKKLTAYLDPEYEKQPNTINGKDYINSPGHVTKEELDNKLKKIFQSGRRAALIHNLELFPSPSPLLFYSYCDNDNAPYKHVAILFTVHLPRELDPSLSPVEMEGLVENFLSGEVWADGSKYIPDAVAALVSRISDTVVIVSAEDEQGLELVCDSS